MQKRTEKNLNKIKTLIAKGVTDQRTIAGLTGVSLPTVNKLCQHLASGIEEKVKRSAERKEKKRKRQKDLVITEMARRDLDNRNTSELFEDLTKKAVIELTSRLPEMEAAELADLVLKIAGLFKGDN